MCLRSLPPSSNMALIKKKRDGGGGTDPASETLGPDALFFTPPLTCLQIHRAKSKGKKQNDTKDSIISTLPFTFFTLCHNLNII